MDWIWSLRESSQARIQWLCLMYMVSGGASFENVQDQERRSFEEEDKSTFCIC